MNKKRKIKWKNILLLFIIILLVATLLISLTNILKWYMDNKNTNDQIDNINQNVTINEVDDSETTKVIQQEQNIPEDNPYWDYIKMKLIDVNFSELKQTNDQVKGWIQVNGTNINYPFVQAQDNEYYLNKSFDKSYNEAGWVFVDYRNNMNTLSKNTIIYAHGRLDKTMFGSLKNILTSGWLKNKQNYVIKLSTETENTLWQVFSVYRIPSTSDYLQIDFSNDEKFYDFAQVLLNRSNHDFNTEVNKNDKILTLSTCYQMTDRVVMHAKLIKQESR